MISAFKSKKVTIELARHTIMISVILLMVLLNAE
jgi:hypothetical protein